MPLNVSFITGIKGQFDVMSLHLPIKLSQTVFSISSDPHQIILVRLCFLGLVDSFALCIIA